MRWLLLVGAKGSQLPILGEDLRHHPGAQAPDELVLEVGFADVEAEPLHVGAAEIPTEAGALEGDPQAARFSRVAEAGHHEVRAVRAVKLEEPAHRLRAPGRNDGNSLAREIPAAAQRERLQRDLVADALHQHDRTRAA